MSYDLTIKGDEKYKRQTSRKALETFIAGLPKVRRNGDTGFVLDALPKRWMEIDLEVVNKEGDNIEQEGLKLTSINCIRLHIPHAKLGKTPERHYFPTAFAIAKFVGWTLYDDQTDEPVEGQDEAESEGDAPPSSPPRAAIAVEAKQLVGQWVSFPYSFGETRMECRLAGDGQFQVTMFDDLNQFMVSAQGTWQVVGGGLEWTYTACKKMPRPRHPQLDPILRVDEKRFVLLESSGSETEFWRTRPAGETDVTLGLASPRPLLDRLIKLIDGGFATREIDRLLFISEKPEPKKDFTLAFRIQFEDMVSPLLIRWTREGDDKVRLHFTAPERLIPKLAAEIKAFLADPGS